MDADYLTDFTSFRVKVGTVDAEHEDFVYTCRGDTIQVVKLVHGVKNCHWVTVPGGQQSLHCDTDTIESKTYSVQALRRNEAIE
ncbi:hypothetical protein [Hymenobacter sp.]|uniref:hypothetical protein n=1 Tax=Hymenobacter sp. TaxID=1898978 RepID=UPI00286D34AE|nr:hypothetical protein [Hymenobacter sp.]